MIADSIEKITSETFIGFIQLVSAEIICTVKLIGSYGFDSCSAFDTVTIGESVETIGDKILESMFFTIPNSVTSIGEYVFLGVLH